MTKTMKAVVIRKPGGPEVLQLERRPIPTPSSGNVLIRVEAFGLNRSELFTRQGHSPGVEFPRILGIEAVGVVAEAPGGEFAQGQTVATVMGGMGRAFDGGYAEFVVVPARQVRSIQTSLPWEVLGALPEMLQTAWGSLFRALRLVRGDRLLIRGGTTSVGMAAAAIGKAHGAEVAGTSRRPSAEPLVRASGADQFFVDDGSIANIVKASWGGGPDKVLELVGTTTLADSLLCAREGGVVCMSGMVGNTWAFENFAPMDTIPTGVSLTTYTGDVHDFMNMPLQELVDGVASQQLPLRVGSVFRIDDIVEAHRLMESNQANGKIVVLTR